jgi:hypothetical protein
LQLFFFTLLSSTLLFAAPFEEFQTTRLKSTAGAGVASVLMDESTILNPAPIAMFNVSSIYFQRAGADLDINASSGFGTTQEETSTAIIVSDSKGGVSGSLSYLSQTQGINERKRFGVSVASMIGERSSFGVSYRFNKEETNLDGLGMTKTSTRQGTFGVLHALSPSFTLGLVAIDPLKAVPGETKGIVGGQYVFNDFISIMLDLGADYNNNLADSVLYRAAMQFKIYNDFFLRFGAHDDKAIKEKGTGVGIGWVQPRLSIDFALRNSERNEDTLAATKEQKLQESSFSVSYRF